MPVHTAVLNCSAFVLEKGDMGSGFFVYLTEDDFDFTYFVTAAHVVWGPERRQRYSAFPPPGSVSIRINLSSGGTSGFRLT